MDIIEGISYEKGLPIESVMEVVKESVIKVAQQTLDSKILYDAEIDKKIKLYIYIKSLAFVAMIMKQKKTKSILSHFQRLESTIARLK